MTITLTISEFDELWAQTQSSIDPEASGLETIRYTPPAIGTGYHREIELDEGFALASWDIHGRDNVRVKNIEWHEHPVEFGVLLSGCISNDVNGDWDSSRTLISGGGIQRKTAVEYHQMQPVVGLSIDLSPSRLAMLFPEPDGQLAPELEFLAKQDDWQSIVYSPNTSEIVDVVRQIRSCPYQGITKRLYLQAKALEIISLQLAPVLDRSQRICCENTSYSELQYQLKPQTIAKLHHAQELIRSNLDNPPTSIELSQQLELSERTLRRGFRSLFGMTVFGYLTALRLQQAESLIRNTDLTIAEIANAIGYAHLGHFAGAFKRKYGINPSECRSGKKSG
jgi:AraC-like DNA-binding protein